MNKQDKIKSQYMGSFKWFKCFKWENLWKWVEDCVCLNSALAGKWCKWALVSIGENWWLLVSIGDYWWAFVSIGEYWSLLPARKGMKRNVYLSSNIIEELILLLQVFCGWKSERGKKAPLQNCSVDISFVWRPLRGTIWKGNENVNYLRRSGVSWGMRR